MLTDRTPSACWGHDGAAYVRIGSAATRADATGHISQYGVFGVRDGHLMVRFEGVWDGDEFVVPDTLTPFTWAPEDAFVKVAIA